MTVLRMIAIFSLGVLVPFQSLAGSPSSLNDLAILRAGIKNVQAIHTHIEVYGWSIAVLSNFEYGSPGTNACAIMKVDADSNTVTQSIHQLQLQKFRQLNLANPVCDPAAGPNKNWSKFTYSDQGQIRRIDWFDQQSGFLIQSAKFDDSAKLIMFDRYTQVIVNAALPTTVYNCGWQRPLRSGLLVEHSKEAADIQVNEMEVYCDSETAFNLQSGLALDLNNNHISLTSLPTVLPLTTATMTVTSVPTTTSTSILTAAPVSAQTPTAVPTLLPTMAPTQAPTTIATVAPTQVFTVMSTNAPTVVPTSLPAIVPTMAPTSVPTVISTLAPTLAPTSMATLVPTIVQSLNSQIAPTPILTKKPSDQKTGGQQ